MQNIIQNKSKIFLFKKKDIKNLKNLAKNSENSRSRVCIHLSKNSKVQEMMVYAIKNSYMPPHKHPPGNSEAYHIIDGVLDLYIFNNKGKILKKIKLKSFNKNKDTTFYYRTSSGNFWHMPVVKSKECIFHEIYSGPFKKKHDVKFPSWAPKENEKLKIRNFFKKINSYTNNGRRKNLAKRMV